MTRQNEGPIKHDQAQCFGNSRDTDKEASHLVLEFMRSTESGVDSGSNTGQTHAWRGFVHVLKGPIRKFLSIRTCGSLEVSSITNIRERGSSKFSAEIVRGGSGTAQELVGKEKAKKVKLIR